MSDASAAVRALAPARAGRATPPATALDEPFELCMFGGNVERRYHRLRPELAALPWGSLRARRLPDDLVARARRYWTIAAYVEHRSAAWIAATVTHMLAARAPMDLIAIGSRYVADELSHVDLCARVLGELGGGERVGFDAGGHELRPAPSRSPLLRATELVVRVFCLGECFSLPMAQHAARATTEPLVRAVVHRIARDEAPHARFGWDYLDWAEPLLDDDDRAHLDRTIRVGLAAYDDTLAGLGEVDEPTLGWLAPSCTAALGREVLETDVVRPLRERGLLG